MSEWWYLNKIWLFWSFWISLKVVFVRVILSKTSQNNITYVVWSWLYDIFIQVKNFCLNKNKAKTRLLLPIIFSLKRRIFCSSEKKSFLYVFLRDGIWILNINVNKILIYILIIRIQWIWDHKYKLCMGCALSKCNYEIFPNFIDSLSHMN